MAPKSQGNWMVPYYHRSGDQSYGLSDRHLYYIEDQTYVADGTEYLLVPNDVKRAYLIKGRPHMDDKKSFFGVSPRHYQLYVTKGNTPLTQEQLSRMRAQYCQKKQIRSHEEKQKINPTPPDKEQPQYIPLFDVATLSTQRMPLGHTASIAAPQKMVIKLYIPPREGGDLVIKTKSTVSRITLHYIDGADEDELVLSGVGQGHFEVKAANGNQLTYSVPSKKFGWYYIRVDHSSALDLENTFGCDVKANDGGTNWVPWNFWYFPFNKLATPHATDADGPCVHFDDRFSCASRSWEWGGPVTPGHTNLLGGGTDGHCDNASLAAIMFELPTTCPPGFTERDLKLFATEYCRRACETVSEWSLPDSLRAVKPNKGSDGTDTEIAGLHQALVRRLITHREPVVMDLRDANGASAAQVWNHAVYKIEIVYAQFDSDPAGNERDIQIVTTLHANYDDEPAAGNPESGKKRLTILRYRLMFDGKGETPGSGSDDLEFVRSGTGVDLHVPRYVHRFSKFRAAPESGTNTIGMARTGNPYMTLTRLNALGLTLRARFYDKARYPQPPPTWADPEGNGGP